MPPKPEVLSDYLQKNYSGASYHSTHYFEQRLNYLLEAIFSTGDGKSMKNAIKIVSMEDKYVLKGIIGFLGGKETIVSEDDHEYSIWKKKGQVLYFEDLI